MKPMYNVKKLLILIATVYSIIVITACSNNSEDTSAIELPQLTSDTVDAATMVLISSPPMQPEDHINRWNPSSQHNSCLSCHATGGGGAPTLPNNHFYNDDSSEDVFRTYCIQCHGEQLDDKPAFNRDN